MAIGMSRSITVALSALVLLAASQEAVARPGEGIGGVEVGIRKKPGTQLVASQRTANDGSFTFKNLPAGSYVVTIGAPVASNPAARSYFESPSNMRVVVKMGADTVTFDLAVKGGALVAARQSHEMSKSVIQNIKARHTAEKPNEVSVELLNGEQISGVLTAVAASNP